MTNLLHFDRIQLFAIAFSLFLFFFIFGLVKNKRVKEEYSILWFFLSFFLIYLSIDRQGIDRLGKLLGVAYPPSVLTLMTTGFTFLLLIHITLVISRLSEQNKELIQELGLSQLEAKPKQADLLVIVPAYNEAKAIGRVIDDLRSIDLPLDILVVNDGSVDATSAEARARGDVIVVDLPKNLGIGGAVQTGFKYAARNSYHMAVQFDGDGQHVAAEIPKLLEGLQEKNVNMVIGSRFMDKQAGFRSTFIRRLGIRLFLALNSVLSGQLITDNTSGFRLYDRGVIEFLTVHYPVDYPEPEAVVLLGRNGFRIAEMPTVMRHREEGDSSIRGIRGGYYMVKVLLAIVMTALRKPLR